MDLRVTPWPGVSTDAIKSKIHSGLESEPSRGVEKSWQPSSLSHLQWDSVLLPAKWMQALKNKSGRSAFLLWKHNFTPLLSHYSCSCYPCERACSVPCNQAALSVQPQRMDPKSHCTELHELHPPLLCGLVSATLDLRHWTWWAWCERLQPWGRTARELLW